MTDTHLVFLGNSISSEGADKQLSVGAAMAQRFDETIQFEIEEGRILESESEGFGSYALVRIFHLDDMPS